MDDVLVVGASAVGGMTAKACAQNGLKVRIAEEHAVKGKLDRCTAIVSHKGLKAIGVNYSPSVLNEVYGARIISGKEEMVVRTPEIKALVLDRTHFDSICVQEAVDLGAEVVHGTKIYKFEKEGNQFKKAIAENGKEFQAKAFAFCDGASSTCARSAGYPDLPSKEYVVGYQAEFSGAEVYDRKLVDLFFDAVDIPGFFGWTVPCCDGSARIGFASCKQKDIFREKKAFFDIPQIKEVLGTKAKKEKEFYHLIPLRPRIQTQLGNSILVGDSAGQVKSSTGGGIVFGGLCAKVAGKELSTYLNGGKLNYEEQWRKEHGDMLKAHYLLRRFYDNSFFNQAGNAILQALIKAGNAVKFNRILERYGDMDFILSTS